MPLVPTSSELQILSVQVKPKITCPCCPGWCCTCQGVPLVSGSSELQILSMQLKIKITCSLFINVNIGAVQVLLGTPGDLPETVKNIHEKGFVPPEQAPSMFVCSAFSIVAGTS